MNRLQSIQLLGFRDNVHVAHWQAPRKTNEHATLGDLYDSILGKIDELTELALARDGNLEFPAGTIGIMNRAPYAELLGSALTLLAEIRATFTAGTEGSRGSSPKTYRTRSSLHRASIHPSTSRAR